MKRLGSLAFAAVALFGFTSQQKVLTNEQAKTAANAITASNLKDYLTFIADDALQGRDTPSPGLDAAANFLAYNLKKWGAKPGGENGTYFQNIKLERTVFNKAETKMTVEGQEFGYEKDFLVYGQARQVSGSLVVIKDKVGDTDVKGKIVLLSQAAMREDPIIAKGGAAAIIMETKQGKDSWIAYVRGFSQFASGFQMPRETPAAPGNVIPRLMASDELFAALSAKAGKTADIKIASTKETATTRNVVAIIEGSDPKLKAEYVAIGAHYDHVGIDKNLTGDQIYNGADDDGSGTVAILSIAEAALKSAAKPKRSMLFVWHAGEEKGLWGSDYYNKNLTVPKGSIVAQLNIDMIGRSKKAGDTDPRNKSLTGPNGIYVIGTTMMSTRLGEIVHGVNDKYLKLDYDKKYDDPKDPNQFFYRSDHYNYAKNGIPICFWFDGEHEDYHQVGDEVSKIDFTKMEKIARTVYITGVTVANEPTRPKVDKPLNR